MAKIQIEMGTHRGLVGEYWELSLEPTQAADHSRLCRAELAGLNSDSWGPSLWLCWQQNPLIAAFSTEIIKWGSDHKISPSPAPSPAFPQPPIPCQHESIKNTMGAVGLVIRDPKSLPLLYPKLCTRSSVLPQTASGIIPQTFQIALTFGLNKLQTPYWPGKLI